MNKAFPGFQDLFKLSDPLSDREFRGEFAVHKQALALTRNEISISEPIQVRWAMGGRKPSDLIWTTSAHPVLIHERVRRLLQEGGFEGWSTYPVVVHGKIGERIDGFHGLSIRGRCGPRVLAQSDVVVQQLPGGWFPHFVGHFFDPSTWDGSDIFMEASDSKGLVTSTKLASGLLVRALERQRTRNIEFTRLDEDTVSTSVFEIAREHLLPADLDRRVDRAYELAGAPRPSPRDE